MQSFASTPDGERHRVPFSSSDFSRHDPIRVTTQSARHFVEKRFARQELICVFRVSSRRLVCELLHRRLDAERLEVRFVAVVVETPVFETSRAGHLGGDVWEQVPANDSMRIRLLDEELAGATVAKLHAASADHKL